MCPESRTVGLSLVVRVSIKATTKYTRAILCQQTQENSNQPHKTFSMLFYISCDQDSKHHTCIVSLFIHKHQVCILYAIVFGAYREGKDSRKYLEDATPSDLVLYVNSINQLIRCVRVSSYIQQNSTATKNSRNCNTVQSYQLITFFFLLVFNGRMLNGIINYLAK